jgi:cyclic pyranopterin phosphate synthase
MTDFTHLDSTGKPVMVDITSKQSSRRTATARSMVVLPDELRERLGNGDQKDDILTKKGAVFQTAIIAGIMAAKKTNELIPLCHPPRSG